MIKEIENYQYYKTRMIDELKYKINKVNYLLKDKGLGNRINQIIDVKNYKDDLIICAKLGYTNSSEDTEILLCYEDEEIKFNSYCDEKIGHSLDLDDLLFFDYEFIFENLDFELDNITKCANKGELYFNY